MARTETPQSNETVQPLGHGKGLRRHLTTSFIGVAAGRVSLTLGGLVFNALLARILAPEQLAQYFLTASLVMLAAIIGELGLGQSIVRTVAAAVGRRESGLARGALISSSQLLLIGVATVSIVLLSPIGTQIAEGAAGIDTWSDLKFLTILWFALQSLQMFVTEAFRSVHQINLATLFGGSVRSLLLTLVLGPAWLLDRDIELSHVLLAIVVTLGVTNLIGLIVLRGKTTRFDEAKPSPKRDLLNIGIPLMLNSLATFAIIRANLWIIDRSGTATEVASYGAAIQLVTLVTTPLLLLNAIVPPIIAERFDDEQGRPELERLLRVLTTIAGAPSLVLLAVFAIFGGELLALVFGGTYRDGSTALLLLAVGQSANVWSGPCGALLKMSGNQWVLFVVNMCIGLATIAFSLWIVPTYGLSGAAAVTAASMLTQNAIQVAVAKKRTHVWTLIYLTPRPIIASFSEIRSTIASRLG